MKGKTVILSVFIMSLVMAQIQVEAKACCPSMSARISYTVCLGSGFPDAICGPNNGCKIVQGTCPKGFENDILENSGDAVNEYCKLGCASSVCGAMKALQHSDRSKIVNGAVEQCAKACFTFCTKGSTAGVGTA